jgi:hypothetical protein
VRDSVPRVLTATRIDETTATNISSFQDEIDNSLLPDRNIAWNPKVDWSRSTIDLSSDEESVPNSISSTELSYMGGFDDDAFGTTAPNSDHELWRSEVLNSHLSHPQRFDSPFRRRAHTMDGTANSDENSLNQQQYNPWRRATCDSVVGRRAIHLELETAPATGMTTSLLQQHSITSQTRSRSGSVPITCQSALSSSPLGAALNKLHLRQQRIPLATRGLFLLFAIATYTTLCIPYSDISADLQKIIDKHGDNTDDTTLMASSPSVSVIVVKDSADHVLGRQFELQSPPQLEQQPSPVASRALGAANFARKRGSLKKFLRREEVANFLQQKAIVQQRSSWIGRWHVHVLILAGIALWALIMDYSKICGPKNMNESTNRLLLSSTNAEIV